MISINFCHTNGVILYFAPDNTVTNGLHERQASNSRGHNAMAPAKQLCKIFPLSINFYSKIARLSLPLITANVMLLVNLITYTLLSVATAASQTRCAK